MKLFLLVICTLSAFGAHAQTPTAAQAAALEAQLEASQAQETAAAVRPVADNLTCEELQTEMVTIAQSPDMQAGLQAFAGQAQKSQEQVAEAQPQVAEPTEEGQGGGSLLSLAHGAATAALPNSVGALATQAEGTVQGARLQAQAAQTQQEIFDIAGQLAGMMGPAMRSQRIMDLAAAKKCEWLNGDPLSAPEAASEPPAD